MLTVALVKILTFIQTPDIIQIKILMIIRPYSTFYRKIVEASECCDGIVRLAVQVYCKCFEIVIAYQTAMNANWISKALSRTTKNKGWC